MWSPNPKICLSAVLTITLTLNPCLQADENKKPTDLSSSCFVPLAKHAQDPGLTPVFSEIEVPKAPNQLNSYLVEFKKRFESLYKDLTPKAIREESDRSRQWARNVDANLPSMEQKKLRIFLRYYFAEQIYTSSQDSAKAQGLFEKRVRYTENLFTQYVPLLSPALCLDEILGATSEEAKAFAKQLQALKNKKRELAVYTEKMEKELVNRIRDNPNFEDHWIHFSSFLFARGRLKEARSHLEELWKLNPENVQGRRLERNIVKAMGIDEPLKRAEFIRSVVKEQQTQATQEYDELHKKKKEDFELHSP